MDDSTSDVSAYLTPNISFDPTVALAGSQSQQFNAGIQQLGSLNQQAFGIEYQVPYAIRYAAPVAIASSDFANSIGVPDPIGTGTGAGDGSGSLVGPPGPAGADGTGVPAGSPAQIQYNLDGASFGADAGLIYDQPTGILGVNNVYNVAGTGHDLLIATESAAAAAGNITIEPGLNTGSGARGNINIINNGASGDISINTNGSLLLNSAGSSGFLLQGVSGAGNIKGSAMTIVSNDSSNANTGNLTINSGATSTSTSSALTTGTLDLHTGAITTNTLTTPVNSGAITITTGQVSQQQVGSTSGAITIKTGNADVSGDITLRIGSGTPITTYGNILLVPGKGNIIVNSGTPTDGQSVIAIDNASNDPTVTPSTGGIMYVSAGALHWLGSSGTDTVIAPA